MNGWELYKIYAPLRRHFVSRSYDIFKYKNCSRNVSFASYESLSEREVFESTARHFSGDKVAGRFCVANFAYRADNWIYEGFTEANDCFLEWQKIRDSINKFTYENTTELLRIKKEKSLQWGDFLARTPKGNHPPLLQLYLGNKILPEMVLLLDDSRAFIDSWNDYLGSDPLAASVVHRLTKYKPFCKIEVSLASQQLIDQLIT